MAERTGNGRGYDNEAATEDDGSKLRPDLVISVQPRQNDYARAELPVSTVDWQSTTRGQFIPVHGLDFLIGVSALQIQQTVELDDLISRIDSENRYIVRVPNGESLYLASEVSSQTQRCLCGSGRAFMMHLHDNTRQEAMQLKRRLAAASCCFPCRLQEMQVITPPGDYIGRVQQQCTWVVPFFKVRDANDQVLYTVEGPAVMKRSALMLSEFKIMTGDSLREVGKIAHGWDRDLVSFTTTLSMPHNAVQPRHKALLLAASFLMFFSDMFVIPPCCDPPETIKTQSTSYYEYYLGEKDEHNRRQGRGENCWTGAESIEWHNGHFVRDTMHGPGEYRCRYRDKSSIFFTYEGLLYLNRLHGYGTMSYADGKVYTGLFNNDIRYGPGVETFANVRANVGLWRGTRLVRLAWRPALGVVPEIQATVGGRALVQPVRVVLHTAFKTIGKVNQAVEFLKQQGADPVSATENWSRLYPKHCTDAASQLCHVELFDYEYYDGKIYSLKERDDIDSDEELEKESQNSLESTGPYYAWNNDPVAIDMMKHSFKHERQRQHVGVDLVSVLSGPRSAFRPPAMHELDCRTLLMASYLGHVASTTYLVNERGVDPNVTDMLGNSAVMYATCGDQARLINFLVEAGADVDSPNDSCCIPLGVALIRFLCARRDVPANGVIQALIPPAVVSAPSPKPQSVFEWIITRQMQTIESAKNTLGRSPSKQNKMNIKKPSLTSIKDLPDTTKKNIDTLNAFEDEPESKLYKDINIEYIIKVTDFLDTFAQPVTYLFELNNMVEDVRDEQQKMVIPEKISKLKGPKLPKEPTKPSKEVIFQNTQKDEVGSTTSIETIKAELFNRMKSTILQLLDNGSKPGLVQCPHPALAMAILAGCPEVVGWLVQRGADVNEVYPQHLSYTPLDMAVSQPLNQSTLDIVQALLLAGARANCRLGYVRPASPTAQTEQKPEPGPTLLHAVLAKKAESEAEEDIRRQIMHLLLEYNCDPLARYHGLSALEVATKSLELLDIIIRSPKTDLNAAIDDSNQTILVKMFWMPYFRTLGSAERSQTLTNLLLFGADPLIGCECEGVEYKNLFVMARKTLDEMSIRNTVGLSTPKGQKLDGKPSVAKPKKAEPKKVETSASDDVANLKQAIDLMTECSRILYIRWLQTQLVKEIIRIVCRYKHRHWSMMIKEYKHKKAAGLWITAQRCLEIWGHLKTTQKNIYKDRTILWNLLCIAHFFHLRSVTSDTFNKVTAAERDEAESYARSILKDNKKDEIVPLQRYVQPELFVRADSKYDVCFECFLPLTEDRVLCESCKFVSFCNMACLKESIEKSNGHACNDYLILNYSPSPEPTDNVHEVQPNQERVLMDLTL